jgi:oligoribonuclease NrnB/cAMP/cGMP phosphodiesterase (DHH superfamily)
MTWKPDICIHHFPCDDGFAAAWVVNRKWPGEVLFAGRNYGQPLDIDLAGKDVLIADFSFKPDVLAAMADEARSIFILDHHKTAAEDLAHVSVFQGSVKTAGEAVSYLDHGDPAVFATFDMEQCGAELTWAFCFPDDPAPKLIRHIAERDLWVKHPHEHTRPLSLLLRSFPYEFEVWDDLMRAFDDIGGDRANVLAEAHAIERFYDRKIAEVCDAAVPGRIGPHLVPVVNAPWFMASDVGHELLQRDSSAAFAAVWYHSFGARTYSLRSEDGREDVSKVARQFGGGGHRNAAGFRVPA